jgi:hypothetical protein
MFLQRVAARMYIQTYHLSRRRFVHRNYQLFKAVHMYTINISGKQY